MITHVTFSIVICLFAVANGQNKNWLQFLSGLRGGRQTNDQPNPVQRQVVPDEIQFEEPPHDYNHRVDPIAYCKTDTYGIEGKVLSYPIYNFCCTINCYKYFTK